MNIKYAFVLSATLVLAACASGSSVVIGTVRPPTDPESVKLYIEPPAEYEVIGLVDASSDSGWTRQGDMDLAVEEIKKQAAKLGANGVLVAGTGEKQESYVVGSTTSGTGSVYGGTVSSQTISGQAIFVISE
jgi:hypothetical protein